MDFKILIRDVPNYPKPGILFKDIAPLIGDAKAFAGLIDAFKARFAGKGISKVCGIEARGFIFGAPLATAMGVGFVPVRKPGKLPWNKISEEYALEYGTDKLEIHSDAVVKGESVLVVDDLLATGGTAAATCRLLERLGARIEGCAFVTELTFLKGREALKGREVTALVQY